MIHGTLLGRLLCDFALVVLIVTLAPGCQGEGKASQQLVQEQPGATKKPKRKPGQPKPYVGDFPSLAKVNIRNAVLEELGSGLEYPWAFEFISDRELLLTEFAGTMKIFNIQTRSMDAVEGLPSLPLSRGQIGLMDVALHPDFARNGIIYFSHADQNESNPELHATGVSRAVLRNGELSDVERIFLARPYGKSLSNFGGALAFDSEGFLYIATGDRSLRDHAQDGGLLTGKIIRLTDDGDTPPTIPLSMMRMSITGYSL